MSSIKNIISIKGAAFTSAVMAVGQQAGLDMLMYYDARPCEFNGMFDFYTMEPLKGYYPFLMYSKLYELENCVESISDDKDIYVVAATEGNKHKIMITYYVYEDADKESKFVSINLGNIGVDNWKCSVLDTTSTMKENIVTIKDGRIELKINPQSVILLEKE